MKWPSIVGAVATAIGAFGAVVSASPAILGAIGGSGSGATAWGALLASLSAGAAGIGHALGGPDGKSGS